jgi:DNA-directed RNA polymerase subunit RPC12/RpoP
MINPLLPRLLFSLVIGGVAAFATWRAVQEARPDDDARYRPRGKRWWRMGDTETGPVRVDSETLSRTRDALSGAALDPGQEIFRCAECQAYYSVASVRALAEENGARCIACGSQERVEVEVVGRQ